MKPILRFFALAAALVLPSTALGGSARERAIEQIPELMGRILDSQEEIRERESEMTPVVRGYEVQLDEARRGIESAASEQEAAQALVDYVEAYSSRLEAQEAGLRSIEPAIVRMRADSRDLIRAAEAARGTRTATPEERRSFHADWYQGVASATSELAGRLDRSEEASTTGAVLHASWASHSALDLPIQEMGPEGAVAFARKVEGLYARFRAREHQLASERRSVRRLLDLLIERQLAHRLDSLFAGGDAIGLGAILSGAGKSQDWQDLGAVVSRTLGLPSGTQVALSRDGESLDRLDFFARGGHREEH
jgi:hypothetical protein